MKFLVAFIFFTITLSTAFAESRENLGRLSMEEVLVQPYFLSQERGEGGFSWGDSQAALRWEMEQTLSAHFRIGDLSLLNRQSFYDPTPERGSFGMIEAYGQWNSPYGRFRMGLIPLEYSAEGELGESELYF
ncbi:MAG: hypothetical protein KDD22_08070, partial [Bdellovibrionales bacterium]|nr:hypothetical protein [Bdellovibrionales bacterium]